MKLNSVNRSIAIIIIVKLNHREWLRGMSPQSIHLKIILEATVFKSYCVVQLSVVASQGNNNNKNLKSQSLGKKK